MTQFSFQDSYEKVDKEYNLEKGQYFKVQEGANRVRLVSIPLPHESSYEGKKNFKWLCQVLDRKDGIVKPYFMPNTIYRFIADFQLSEDYRFNGCPMPYDITINAKNAGTKEVQYSAIPGKETPLTTEEQNLITEAPTVQELQKRVKDNEKSSEGSQTPPSPEKPLSVASVAPRANPETIGEEFLPEDPYNTNDVPF